VQPNKELKTMGKYRASFAFNGSLLIEMPEVFFPVR